MEKLTGKFDLGFLNKILEIFLLLKDFLAKKLIEGYVKLRSKQKLNQKNRRKWCKLSGVDVTKVNMVCCFF